MKTIFNTTLTLALGIILSGCPGTDENGGPDGTKNTAPDAGTSMQTPPAPTPGAQIDRMGRPAINTALSGTFRSDETAKANQKNAYNAATPNTWATFVPEIAANAAILDGLDTNCGNQLLAGPMPVAGRYDGLAGALADDKVYVNSAATTCGQYLAVEANATGVIPNDDCGGRTPVMDVVDTSYSVLAIGSVMGVGDGVAEDGDAVTHSTSVFPFLAAP